MQHDVRAYTRAGSLMWEGDCVHMQASLPFEPSAAAQALVQQSAAQLQARRWAAAADRRRLMALTNARRCSMQPLYGEDLLRAVHVDLPVHHVNITKDKVRQLRLHKPPFPVELSIASRYLRKRGARCICRAQMQPHVH